MPKITQARPGAAANGKVSGGLLSRFGSVRDRERHNLKFSAYGQPKGGKTRFLSTFPKPIAIIGGEDGTASIANVDGIDFVQVILNKGEPPKDGKYVRLSELGDLLEELRGADYATVAVDTADALSELFLSDVLGLESVPTQKAWGMATRSQYGTVSLKLRTVLRDVLALDAHSVILAHEKVFGGGDESESEQITPTVGSAISSSAASWLNGKVDYVCQIFKRQKEVTRQIKLVEGKTKTVTEKSSDIEYCLRVGNHAIYTSGFRCPVGTVLPDVIVDPTFEKIAALAYGEPDV